MSSTPTGAGQAPMQFDAAVTAAPKTAAPTDGSPPFAPPGLPKPGLATPALATPALAAPDDPSSGSAAACAQCGASIRTLYYALDGKVLCPACKHTMEQGHAAGGTSGAFARAALYGAGSAFAGALLYFTVMAVTGMEIGLISIAVGWLVGTAISKATGGRGGRRYQVLAVALTYLAIDATYFGYAVKSALDKPGTAGDSAAVALRTDSAVASAGSSSGTASDSAAAAQSGDDGERPSGLLMFAFVLGLPIVANVMSLPGGLIGLAIVFFALSQAWRMTAGAPLVFSGPHRLGPGRESVGAMPAGG